MKACSCVRGGGRLAAYGLAACWGGPNSGTCERFFFARARRLGAASQPPAGCACA